MRHLSRVVMVCLVLLPGCASRPPATDYTRPVTHAVTPDPHSPLGRALAQGLRAHPGESGFHLLQTGTAAFLTRIAMVEAGTQSVDLQYFSTRDDTTGKLLLQALLSAADRGVRVRMLLDDWNLDDFHSGVAALNTHPHIEIRVFNPYTTRDQSLLGKAGGLFTRLGQFTHRMHNKALIVDNRLAIVGGRNLGNEYFDAGADFNFRDMDVLAAGPIVPRISRSFDAYWNGDEAYPVSALLPRPNADTVHRLRAMLAAHWKKTAATHPKRFLHCSSFPARLKSGALALTWAHAELAVDAPDKVGRPTDETISRPAAWLDRLAEKAHHEFIIITPYFVPMDSGVAWLASLVRHGIAVRVLTNSLGSTDIVPAFSGYSHYRPALLRAGVALYEMRPRLPGSHLKSMFTGSSQYTLHAKMYVFDRRELVIGSFNFDPRSIHLNTEMVLIIHSPHLAHQVVTMFKRTITSDAYHVMLGDDTAEPHLLWITRQHGHLVRFDRDPSGNVGRDATAGFFSLLPIDNQL